MDATMNTQRRIDIYTDGSCLKNPDGPGGYAAIILINGVEAQHFSGSDPSTTSNRMEMMGVIAGLEALHHPASITVYSDSQLVINCASRQWKRKKNLDLWKRLDAAASRHRVKWQWVRGHNGNIWNEAADALCGLAARNGQLLDESHKVRAEEREWEREAWERFGRF
jgi:ribonuclease HI